MSQNFYLSLFPIGEIDWKQTINSIIFSMTIKDSAYKCFRFTDSINDMNGNIELPTFIPHEAINLDGEIKFRIAIGLPLLSYSKTDLISSPWTDEPLPYNEASELALIKIVESHSDYVLILRDKEKDKANLIAEKVIATCLKYNKKYMILDIDKRVKFEKIYNHFIGVKAPKKKFIRSPSC